MLHTLVVVEGTQLVKDDQSENGGNLLGNPKIWKIYGKKMVEGGS